TNEEKATVGFYDENFTPGKQVELNITWGKAREAIYTFDSSFLCVGFPRTLNVDETDFNFYVLTTAGEVVANKIFSKIEIKSLIMSGQRILLVSLNRKDNALHYHLLDLMLNPISEKLIPLKDKKALEN